MTNEPLSNVGAILAGLLCGAIIYLVAWGCWEAFKFAVRAALR